MAFILCSITPAAIITSTSPKDKCIDSLNANIEWSDSIHSLNHGKSHPKTEDVFCYLADTCNPDQRTKLRSMDIKVVKRSIQYVLTADGKGRISDLTWEDSGMPEKSFPQLLNAIPSDYKLGRKYWNGKLSGMVITDSVGVVTEFFVKKFVSAQGLVDTSVISRKTDSIANIGKRSPESILKVIRENIGRYRYIYESYLKQNPGLSGKIKIKFAINQSGEVASIKRISSNSKCFQMDNEIIQAAKKMKFESVPFGDVWVTYAFVLDRE